MAGLDHARAAEMEAGGGHAARQRSYLHEDLGPGGGVLHHAIHHTDESLALTHLQRRKEWTIQTRTPAELSPHLLPGLTSPEQERAARPGVSGSLCLTLPVAHPL